MPNAAPNQIFVSYAHEDRSHQEELLKTLGPLIKKYGVRLWVDTLIKPGEPWLAELEEALVGARIAILLVSSDFLSSKFIGEVELPSLFNKAQQGGTQILWIPIRDCCIEDTPLFDLEPAWPLDRPISGLTKNKRATVWKHVADQIRPLLGEKMPTLPVTLSTRAAFRVLLLSSEKDLGASRAKVAAYLQRLGMEVCAHDGDTDCQCEFHDQVVLLLAWRWQGGQAIGYWENVPESKRSLFLMSEHCAWPVSEIEKAALINIVEFRECYVAQAKVFETVEDLPSSVGDLLDTLRRERMPLGAIEVGLSEVERNYLKLNLPAWRAGRNQLARSDQKLGGYEANRWYNEKLYVAMDGQSQRFGRNERGDIISSQSEATLKDFEMYQAPLAKSLKHRLPLAEWATAPGMRRMVVSGSPGAGKTVFLTRFAAELAAHLLGEEISEPILTALYPRNSLGPIPVVLEAQALSNKSNGVKGLIQALRHALELGGGIGLPGDENLERQLQQGRFLLLVDALDEVDTEDQRRFLVYLLKGIAGRFPKSRLLVTTRSARYTGNLPYSPEFEIVDLMPLSQGQVAQFCRQYRIDQCEKPGFELDLLKAIAHVEEREPGDAGETLSGNALMLTTLCGLYHRDRRLPDDRVSLCSRLVDRLCEARPQPGPNGRPLSSGEKRELLSHLALAMQKAGAQVYGHSECVTVIADCLPDAIRHERVFHERLLRCLVEQTGLMYYEADKDGQEQLRFVHRLLREYLAALRLLGDDRTMEKLVADLAEAGQLSDPFWFDTVRMLPGLANSQEKAATFAHALLSRAESAPATEARLWGTLAASLQENRQLYPRFDFAAFTQTAMERYHSKGLSWKRDARFLLLEHIGALGDPRLNWRRADYWVRFGAGDFVMGDIGEVKHKVEVLEPFFLAKYPLTNVEYRVFVESGGYGNLEYWSDLGKDWLNASEEHQKPLDFQGFCQSNQPRVGVCFFEAEAYCSWLRSKWEENHPFEMKNFLPCLPNKVQWEYAGRGKRGAPFPWGCVEPSIEHANFGEHVGKTSSVGAYPQGDTPEGLCDMVGNVLEFCSDEKAKASKALRGGNWSSLARFVDTSCRYWAAPNERSDRIGFRLALTLIGS